MSANVLVMFPVSAYAAAMRDVRKGRGAASNRSGRYERHRHEAFDDGWDTIDEAHGRRFAPRCGPMPTAR